MGEERVQRRQISALERLRALRKEDFDPVSLKRRDPLIASICMLPAITSAFWLRLSTKVSKRRFLVQSPSRTVHAVSNVEVVSAERGDEATVRCAMTVTELREGDFLQLGLGEQRVFAGHCEFRLQQRKDGLAIAIKKLVLISRDLPIENLSFLL